MDDTRTKHDFTEAEMEELKALRIKAEQQKNDPRADARTVSWDVEHNRPVVGGMITHPVTGEVVKRGEWITTGPPDVDIIWYNLGSSDTAFTSVRASLSLPVDKVFVAVAEHVRDGHYSIVSINASAYSFVIICDSELTSSELGKLHRSMYSN